jgi:ribosome maturation factor RimP
MEIEKILDDIDPIPYSYILEVSSPGIERPLKRDKDFIRFIGSLVEIKTFEKIEGKKLFTGTLEDYSDGIVTISNGQKYSIPREKISSAKLKYNWDGESR